MVNTFGDFLKEKRQEKKLTQKELAKLLFVSESAVSKWEKNVAHPDITLLPKLSEILAVSEHELITASIDERAREEKAQAKKWRTLSFSWSLFFYIAYLVALIPCFICDLAINKTLSWFWIVLASLLLAFTFTNLPKLINKNKLVLLPLSMYLALCVLLGVCAIYTNGGWYWVASLSVLLGMVIIFGPIYIAKLKIFKKIKKYNDFVSIGVDFVLLNVLLVVINIYTLINGFSEGFWYAEIAFPIVVSIYFILNLLMCVRFLKVNKLIKAGIILSMIDVVCLIPSFIKLKNIKIQNELDDINIFRTDFSNWQPDVALENNIWCIIFLTILTLAIVFFTFGILSLGKQNKRS